MIHGIHHTAISSADIERSLHFYRDLLGFEEVFNLKGGVLSWMARGRPFEVE